MQEDIRAVLYSRLKGMAEDRWAVWVVGIHQLVFGFQDNHCLHHLVVEEGILMGGSLLVDRL